MDVVVTTESVRLHAAQVATPQLQLARGTAKRAEFIHSNGSSGRGSGTLCRLQWRHWEAVRFVKRLADIQVAAERGRIPKGASVRWAMRAQLLYALVSSVQRGNAEMFWSRLVIWSEPGMHDDVAGFAILVLLIVDRYAAWMSTEGAECVHYAVRW